MNFTQKKILKSIVGLEKGKTLPATGTWNDFRTEKMLRPGMDDFIDIPIYQGEPFTKSVFILLDFFVCFLKFLSDF